MMFRILQLRCVTQNKHKFLAARTSGFVTNLENGLQNFTSLCNTGLMINANISKDIPENVRLHSTIPTAELIEAIIKKRKKKTKKKYTDLLEVTKTSTSEIKTSVQKLNAKKLSDFIQSTSCYSTQDLVDNTPHYSKHCVNMLENDDNINNKLFDEMPAIFVGRNMNKAKLSKETIREIIESYHTMRDIHEGRELIDPLDHKEELESGLPEEIPEIIDMENDINEDSKLMLVANKTLKKSNPYKSKYHKSHEQEIMAKQKSFSLSLGAFLDVCIASGMINRAWATVLHYRYRSLRYNIPTKVVDIELYNVLIHGYAEKGHINRIKEIFHILKEDRIEPNAQTFAAIFECLGRLPSNTEVIKNIHKYNLEAINMGISLNDILNKSKFISDQREIVMEVIRMIEPEFNPEYKHTNLKYNNHLVNSLNEHVSPVDKVFDSSEKIVGSEIMNSKAGFTRQQLEEYGRKQLEHELSGYVKVKNIEQTKNKEPNEQILYYRKKLNELQDCWRKQICFAFNRDASIYRAKTDSRSSRMINLFPYLKSLNVEHFAEIVLNEIRMLAEGSETYSPTVSQLYKALGKKVEIRYHMEQKRVNGVLDKTLNIYGSYCDIYSNCNTSDNSRQSWQRLVYQNQLEGPSLDIYEKQWPMSAVSGVGKFLYNILMRDLKIDVNAVRINHKTQNMLPAFYTLFRNQGRFVREEVKPHPVLIRLYRNSQPETLVFDVNLVPMFCPPQPWTTVRNGGYLLARSDLIRLPHQAQQQFDRINDTPLENLYPSLDSLNQLASVPWKINTDILDVIVKVFTEGGSEKLDIPRPPSALEPIVLPENQGDMSKIEKFKLFRQKLNHKRKQGEMYSLWCDALYRLSLANHFRNSTFWLPHNMDFRGRVYPIPPHLNHLGSDMARCLLVFNQAKPLGKDGFNWIKLHCINLTGFKKRDSVADRLKYADKVMDNILDSADNPLTGKMWWAKSDEPWQTLSACMEIAKIHRCGDPENYMSCFPVHQDGSCNGLQHYAALGRDEAGAFSVNLVPCEIPQDVYSSVASLVEASRNRDAKSNIKVAEILDGFVRRKVIKQTVMTTVYGVTRYGARIQIARQLKDIDEFPRDWVWPASTYLTTKTFESLREMFTSTREIQDWFTDCARLISAICSENVEWITPLGLPVVQPYSRFSKHNVALKSSKSNEHFSIDSFEKPNIMKQKNAFPPNFIHSLDSSHMMLTSMYCERAGLTFISVHDCYWTHACTVPEMNKICRQQFVALHSEPILEELSKFMIEKYSYKDSEIQNDGSVKDVTRLKLNNILKQLPKKGTFDLNKVLKSVYFFS